MSASAPDGDFRFTYRIYPEHRCAVGRIAGRVGAQDMSAAFHGLYGDPLWIPGYALLWDDRGLTGVYLEREEGRFVADEIIRDRARIGDGPVAVVIQDDILAAVADMLAGLADLAPEQVRIFDRMSEALAWLDIPSGLLDFD